MINNELRFSLRGLYRTIGMVSLMCDSALKGYPLLLDIDNNRLDGYNLKFGNMSDNVQLIRAILSEVIILGLPYNAYLQSLERMI